MHLFSRLSTPEISVDELDALLRNGTVRVLDVREDWSSAAAACPERLMCHSRNSLCGPGNSSATSHTR